MRGQTSLSRPETEWRDGVGGVGGRDSLFAKGSEPGFQGGGRKRRT